MPELMKKLMRSTTLAKASAGSTGRIASRIRIALPIA
jgi:hypothetical protein